MDSQVIKVRDSFEVEVWVLSDLAGGWFVKAVGEDGSRFILLSQKNCRVNHVSVELRHIMELPVNLWQSSSHYRTLWSLMFTSQTLMLKKAGYLWGYNRWKVLQDNCWPSLNGLVDCKSVTSGLLMVIISLGEPGLMGMPGARGPPGPSGDAGQPGKSIQTTKILFAQSGTQMSVNNFQS